MYKGEKGRVYSRYMEKIGIKIYWVFRSSTGKETMSLDPPTPNKKTFT